MSSTMLLMLSMKENFAIIICLITFGSPLLLLLLSYILPNSSLKEENDSLKQQIDQLKNDISNKNKTIEQFKKDNINLNKSLAEKNKTIDSLKKENSELRRKVGSSETQQGILQASRNAWEAEQRQREAQLRSEIASLKNQLAQSQQQSRPSLKPKTDPAAERQKVIHERFVFNGLKAEFEKEKAEFEKEKKEFAKTCESFLTCKAEYEEERRAFDQKSKVFEEILSIIEALSSNKGSPFDSSLRLLNLFRDPKNIYKFDKASSDTITPIAPITVSCSFQPSDSREKPYTTTLTSCTCKSFTKGHDNAPCKHMIWLAIRMGAVTLEAKQYDKILAELSNKTSSYITALDDFKRESKKQEKREKTINEKMEIVRSSELRHPELARILSYYDDKIAQLRLEYLSNRAPKAAESAKILIAEKAKYRKELDLLQGQLSFYLKYFPWLEYFENIPLEEARKCANQIGNDTIIGDRLQSHFEQYAS